MASASTPSVDEQAKDDIFNKAHISGRMISSGISNVAIVSVYSEKTCLKKLIMIIIIITSKSKRSCSDGYTLL